jgi:hypothetical protein
LNPCFLGLAVERCLEREAFSSLETELYFRNTVPHAVERTPSWTVFLGSQERNAFS